jgi:putative glutamine amidotransferase
VTSSHHQALADGGTLEVIGRSDDGVVEAVRDPARAFYVGVQWHPERTTDHGMGVGIVRMLVDAARTGSLSA